eukprot:TRINITY_DN901_c0_g3_i1.p1 TRINITY_DN901_c0_g3~~TRINITY_DN901_c0_g3_i1.p1  ORF type:complete len:181 (+),score=27.22 TRINITY_DN901_c0_g3_i1:73-615(+)
MAACSVSLTFCAPLKSFCAASFKSDEVVSRRTVLRSSLRGCWPARNSLELHGCGAGKSRVNAWFKFGKAGFDSESAGIYGSQAREDFDRDDVEQYFNYMGMLATEGTYDKMEALLNTGIPPIDIILMLAATEGDRPKIEELLRAGADITVKDVEGRTAVDRATEESIKELLLSGAKAKAT